MSKLRWKVNAADSLMCTRWSNYQLRIYASASSYARHTFTEYNCLTNQWADGSHEIQISCSVSTIAPAPERNSQFLKKRTGDIIEVCEADMYSILDKRDVGRHPTCICWTTDSLHVMLLDTRTHIMWRNCRLHRLRMLPRMRTMRSVPIPQRGGMIWLDSDLNRLYKCKDKEWTDLDVSLPKHIGHHGHTCKWSGTASADGRYVVWVPDDVTCSGEGDEEKSSRLHILDLGRPSPVLYQSAMEYPRSDETYRVASIGFSPQLPTMQELLSLSRVECSESGVTLPQVLHDIIADYIYANDEGSRLHLFSLQGAHWSCATTSVIQQRVE